MKSVYHNGKEYRFYDHLYAVAKDGELLRQLKPYTPTVRPDNYLSGGRNRLVHRMVATCWVAKPNNAANAVHHKDHNKQNNHADNLEWTTLKEHIAKHHPDVIHRLTHYERTPAHREHLRQLRLGTKHSEATKQKQREANLRLGIRPPSPRGRKLSEAHKRQLALSRSRRCRVFGITYRSFTEAGKALNQRPLSLRKRCLSNNFPDYQVID